MPHAQKGGGNEKVNFGQYPVMSFKIPGICILLVLIPLFVYAQSGIIKGIILDGQTNQPLPYASVYINHTTIGTSTDEQGRFQLAKLPAGEYSLIVSFVGHIPHQSDIVLLDSTILEVRIRLTLQALKEVEIHGKKDARWEKQLAKFNKLFIGEGPNAGLCRILNPWALSFPEIDNKNFVALASEVLVIENLGLGYRVFYQLKDFVVNRNHYRLDGYLRFEEIEAMDSLLAQQFSEKRAEAYEGSVRHFLKSIVDQRLKPEGYDLYEDKSNLRRVVRLRYFSENEGKTLFRYYLDEKISAGERPNLFTIQFPPRVEIHYNKKITTANLYQDIAYPVSWIEVEGGFLNVNEDGIVINPLQMTVSGQMFNARAADLLPYDYKPGKIQYTEQKPLEKKRLSALTYLTEKPYLHTNKSYYYPDEVIWFKGYMNYFTPLLKDSLSHVLYVDLADEKGKIITTRIFSITNGTIVGDLTLPSLLEKGNYSLRAYTRWMLNFDPSYMFVKPVSVLDTDEMVMISDYQPENKTTDNISITAAKEYYLPRDKITLTIDVVDDLDLRVPANLSLSVTDVEQARPVQSESTILSDFTMPVVSLPDTLDAHTRYFVQNGFDIKGRFIPGKGKQVEGLLTLVQENNNMEYSFTTEKDGTFFVSNLIHYDTTELSIIARSLKGRSGSILFDTITISPPLRSAIPLQIQVYKSENAHQRYLPDSRPATHMLKEVTIKSSRIVEQKSTIFFADYTVTGEWLRDRHVTDMLSALQIKVPGLRVIGAPPGKYLLLSGSSGFGSFKDQEPLVLIDGLVVNDLEGGPAEQISQLSPQEIDHIEVTKFGMGASYGARGGNGVISIYTRKGYSDEEKSGLGSYDKSKLQKIHMAGYSTTKKFSSPDYSAEDRYDLPDYRSTIYWNPMITLDGENPNVISFFAADLVTEYRIVVEGVTDEGNALRGEKTISVRKLP